MQMQNSVSSLSVLYVEDQLSIRKNAVEYLSRICAKVFEAKDGLEALRVHKEQSIDVIITDINMPCLSGLELAKRVRQSDKKIPIIIVSAYTDTEYLIEAVELHLIRYIVKPVTSKKLNEALALACEQLSEDAQSVVKFNQETIYDATNKTLIVDRCSVKLTKNELLLLDLLCKNIRRVVIYQEIENHIWIDVGMSIDALRSLVRTLRKKLGGDFVENCSGIGYKIKIDL